MHEKRRDAAAAHIPDVATEQIRVLRVVHVSVGIDIRVGHGVRADLRHGKLRGDLQTRGRVDGDCLLLAVGKSELADPMQPFVRHADQRPGGNGFRHDCTAAQDPVAPHKGHAARGTRPRFADDAVMGVQRCIQTQTQCGEDKRRAVF